MTVVLGPALLFRADWMWRTNNPEPPRSALVRHVWQNSQDRLNVDLLAGKPWVVHVTVALADNASQGLVPVDPPRLADGNVPDQNLYWGARYGIAGFLTRDAGWRLLETRRGADVPDLSILERRIYFKHFERDGVQASAFLIADAWRGETIQQALAQFVRMSAGHEVERIELALGDEPSVIRAGGAAHVQAYVGHNGLMEFDVPAPQQADRAASRSAIVLACASQPDFEPLLRGGGAHPLLLTTDLMAPEAYTLAAALERWLQGAEPPEVRTEAARAYARYQKIDPATAEGLFVAGIRRSPRD